MTPASVAAGATAFAVALVAARALARLAPRLGWLDRAAGAERARKLQERPVPPVGGAAVLAGLVAGALVLAAAGAELRLAARGARELAWLAPLASPAGAAAVALAFLAGLVDDALRLAPARKLAAQLVAAAPLAIHACGAPTGGVLAALGALALALVALNAVNTFDNADGAATSVGALGLALGAPLAALALLGFLPSNVDGRRPAAAGRRAAPTAYLGDSGSHLVGMLVALCPPAWPALTLPLVDLARLSFVRTRAGSRPWIGDRRHLAHRLEARFERAHRLEASFERAHRLEAGFERRAGVVLALVAVAAPSALAGAAGVLRGEWLWVAAGVAGTLALYAAAVLATRGTR